MGIAQSLYEGVEIGSEGAVGLITYMRTDSTRVGAEAQQEARELIAGKYGKEFLPEKPPVYASAKTAQEAHEAIRPTSAMREPDAIRQYLEPDQYKLYRLIWNRFVASQMNPAVIDQTSVDIAAGGYTFRATGSVVKFPGFMAVYIEEKAEDQQPSEDDSGEAVLPQLAEGDTLNLLKLDPSSISPSPRRATPRRSWSRPWRKKASGGRAPTRPSFRPSRTGLCRKGGEQVPPHGARRTGEPSADPAFRQRPGCGLHGAHGDRTGQDRGRRDEMGLRGEGLLRTLRQGPCNRAGRDEGP